MKAAIRKKYGDFETIEIIEFPKPKPKEDEVIVKIHATTVNRTDCAVVTGAPFLFRFFIGFPRPKRLILGTDFSGVVEVVGQNVTTFQVGDKVFGFNDEGLQSQVEYMTISANGNITKMPDNISFEQAAASLEGAHYAINFMNKVTITANQKILVYGATGAIGSAMIQLLKAKGCYVTAVANTKNMELIRSFGVNKIYDYQTEDFTMDTTKYDYVFDAVGKSSFGVCKPLLKKGGVYISSELGPGNENLYLPLTTKFLGDKKVIFPMPSDIKKSLEVIKNALENGTFKPMIDRQYPLMEIVKAYNFVNSGQKTGNVIINFI